MFFQSLSQFGRARLARTLTLWVFGSFMLIEIAVLIPSYHRRAAELEAQLMSLYPASVQSSLERLGVRDTFEDWLGLPQLQANPEIKGIALYDAQGQPEGTWGEIPHISSSQLLQVTMLERRGNLYMLPYAAPGDRTILLALDRTPIQQELHAYIWRIFGLIALIGAVVTITTMVGLEVMVIQPIVRLRRDLLQFGEIIEQQAMPKFHPDMTYVPDNELGDMMRAFAQLCDRVTNTMDEHQSALVETQQARRQSHALRKALNALENKQLQLIRNEKMLGLGQLVAGLSHELNNPMTFITGNLSHAEDYLTSLLELVRCYQTHVEQPLPAVEAKIDEIDLPFLVTDFPQVIASIDNGVNRIQTIVNSLRSFARLDESDQKTVDLHLGIEQALLILGHRLQKNSDRGPIALQRHYDDLPAIECYPGRLNQVFLSLLTNAIDAFEDLASTTPRMDCRITIETRWTAQEERVQILIADNGRGIDPEIKNRIFDPFFTTKPVGSGTGLGLAIAYQIIHHNHSGELVLRSQPGIGTECWIDLPSRLPHDQT